MVKLRVFNACQPAMSIGLITKKGWPWTALPIFPRHSTEWWL